MEFKSESKLKRKTNLNPASYFFRFLAVPFGLLMCYGAFQKLSTVNMSLSIDHWGTLVTGIILTAAPFIMNRFLSIILIGMGTFTVVNLFHPDTQSWLNLVLFIAVTLLLFKPYKIWLRIIIQLMCLGIIASCLYYVYQEFYKGIEHFVVTGKLTDSFLSNRIKTYLPGDFSYYMCIVFIVISIRQYIPMKKQPIVQNNYNSSKADESNTDLWGY